MYRPPRSVLPNPLVSLLKAYGNFDTAVAGVIAVTITSGALTLDRLLPGIPAGVGQIKLWGTVALVLVAGWKISQTNLRGEDGLLGENAWTLAPLVVLSGLIFLRSVPEFDTSRAQEYMLNASVMSLDALAIWVLVRRHGMMLKVLAWLTALGTVLFLLALFGVGQPEKFGEGWSPIGSPASFYRLTALGNVAALALCWSVPEKRRLQMVLAALAVAMGFGMLASASRTVPLALALGSIWLLVGLAAKGHYRRGILVFCGLILVSGLFAATKAGLTVHRYAFLFAVSETKPVEKRDLDQEGLDFLYGEWAGFVVEKEPVAIQVTDRGDRLALVYMGLDLARQHPLFGAGPNGFKLSRKPAFPGDSSVYTYPHNIVLEMLSLAGVVGGGLLLLAIGGPLVPALRAAVRDDRALAFGAYLPFALMASALSGDIYDFRLFWYVALLLPLMAAPIGRSKNWR